MVSAGGRHTVLLRSDGRALAVGDNGYGQCTVLEVDGHRSWARCWGQWRRRYPVLPRGITYQADNGARRITLKEDLVVQLCRSAGDDSERLTLSCLDLAGVELMSLTAERTQCAVEVLAKLALALGIPGRKLRVVMPDGSALSSCDQGTRIAAFF